MESDASNNFPVAAFVFAAGTYLPSRCLATIIGYTYRHTERSFLAPLFLLSGVRGEGYTGTQAAR
jgi:hypothetical protein